MSGPGELRVLGSVEAVGPRGPAGLHGTRQRAVLGMLALHAGTVLAIPRLIDLLWGEDPPRTAVKTLHSHVARIRQALEDCGFPQVLHTRKPGYVLDIDPDTVDACRFERLVRAARAATSASETATALRTGLALWRGDAFADAGLDGWGRRELDRLQELRRSALEDLWDAELRLGNHLEAVRELPAMVAESPHRERLAGLYMLALYRGGRHADALEAFQRLRRGLADEFGVDPGPELLTLHTQILRRDPELAPGPTGAVPSQLPARVGYFTGREDELAALEKFLGEPGDERPVVVISGAAGMGKSALAVQWAHRIAGRFPDGRLFLDLHGHDPDQSMAPADALAHLLRGLGLPDERMPDDPAERAALYRSLLHGKRCVIVADNAGSVGQVLPLVPGSEHALLIVTSRRALAALGSRHAVYPITLDAFGHQDSVALLTRVLGAERVGREPAEAARLAGLCGGMPLALRLAAARLTGEPGRAIGALATELTGGRLDSLTLEGDSRTVRTVLASAYQPLEPAHSRLFRLFGLIPADTFTGALGAAMSGMPAETGRAAAAELCGAHLITAAGPDRYRFHDLVREFAGQLAEDSVEEAQNRLVDWYLYVAAEANRVIDPNRDLVTPELHHPAPERPFAADRRAALTFLGAERGNLLPVARFAASHGRLVAAWQLTYLLTSFYDTTGHWYERVDLCRVGAEAAAALGDPLAEAEMLRALGVAYFMTRRLRDALATNAQALRAARAAGDLDGEGHILNNTANAHAAMRRFDEAIDAYRQAVDRCTTAGNRLGRALSERNLGHAYVRKGQPAAGLEPLTNALSAFRALGNARLEAATLDTLGEAYLELGEHDLALDRLGKALAASRAIGDRWQEWESLLHSGQVHLSTRDFRAARADFAEALTISRDVGNRHSEAAALDRLARAELGLGDLDAARDHLELGRSVRELVPDDYEQAHLYADLGDLEARSGHAAAAAAHRARAIELYRRANATAEADDLSARQA
ncbi:MAG TPA: BTAD domain-containing putative transcriptional regulator [Amycolatopsis sp.]|nr:BTAD domain-containing putative transcriptional regulator [Amycolatopsis sp.]